MAEKKVKIKVEHLTKKFGDLLVLNDMSFDVEEGEFLCVVGPTGCGKTTFLNSVTKLYDITSGRILVNGEEVDLKKHNISYIFQEFSAMPWLTIEQNVGFGLDVKKVPKDEKKRRVDEILLMDEPYGQLDIDLRFKLEDELIRLWKETGTTVIFITHNVEEAVYLSEHIMVLTNKPSTVKTVIDNTLPRPRDVMSLDFVKLRDHVTEMIKWW